MPFEPSFWWRRDTSPACLLLAPAAFVYGTAAEARWRFTHPAHVDVPVICIGNFTAGGGGKTPCAIATAKLLARKGANPIFLTRGYGGSQAGPYLVDGKGDGAALVGDEPLLLANHAPTIVARDRVKGAARAVREGAGAIVMDDGFQNPQLAKDLSVIALDGEVGVGNGWVLPSGPLRARLAYQVEQADALVVIGSGDAGNAIADVMADRGKPIFRADYAPTGKIDWLKKQPVIAFAGIARPSKFFANLECLGATLRQSVPFPDHHSFTARDAARLLDLARANSAQLVTTEKDLARLKGSQPDLRDLSSAARAFPIKLRFEDEKAYADLLANALTGANARQ